jgi:hypothetical protein
MALKEAVLWHRFFFAEMVDEAAGIVYNKLSWAFPITLLQDGSIK